mmetsp:Transcript_13446/g.18034  ORF Transcript_13446/g.18034 Transcript_13446/m.18034 type:complete len:110 (-) Transcript_13446:718-1047(-)
MECQHLLTTNLKEKQFPIIIARQVYIYIYVIYPVTDDLINLESSSKLGFMRLPHPNISSGNVDSSLPSSKNAISVSIDFAYPRHNLITLDAILSDPQSITISKNRSPRA